MYLGVAGACAEQAANAGPGPLGLSLDESFIEIFLVTEEAQSSNEGEIVVTASATGGTSPYSFSWLLNRESDDDDAFSINMGTTNDARWEDAIITTTYLGPPNFATEPPSNLPPTPASFSIFCVVTDDNGDQASASMTIDATAE